MGSVGCRFGRNVPLELTYPEPELRLMTPNPRDVSRELLTREEFQPATTLNVLAAAWLQFEVHDWFDHGPNETERPWKVSLRDDDPWPENPMQIPRTREDPTWTDDGSPRTFATVDSHWWDGSQVYGNTEAFARKLRTGEGGRVRIADDGLPPKDLDEGADLSGEAGNFWVGLGLLHTIFMLEHNAIADRLRAEYPSWSDDRLYNTARLVNVALMAKIHAVEWTPAIIAHPVTERAMRVTWWGFLGQNLKRRIGPTALDELTGIPGSKTDHHTAPYSLTEEFVAVYRMHPLLPDDYTFRSVSTDEVIERRGFMELTALHARERLLEIGMANGFYSMGVEHPGALVLHNYPRALQELHRPDGTIIDMAAADVLRIRERGVPRYTKFRELFHMRVPRTFEELTNNPAWAEELRRVYDNDLESVDLMTGLFAEPPPRGFGFSDTAFRVFILMAGRRLKSDRFFTVDYRPEIYTQVGLDWVDRNTMITVLLRHFPELEPALAGVDNAFVPWTRVGGSNGTGSQPPAGDPPVLDAAIPWKESFVGGSAESEERVIDAFLDDIRAVQETNRRSARSDQLKRAFHAKQIAGVKAVFRVDASIPERLRVGLFEPGATYDAVVRFSNANGVEGSDADRDLRGMAVRVEHAGAPHDFLMTSAPASHARDAVQFVRFAQAVAGRSRLGMIATLMRSVGPKEALRMLKVLVRDTKTSEPSVALERYWSRGPFALGPYAVKFMFEPVGRSAPLYVPPEPGRDALRDELATRLRQRNVEFRFGVQFFVDEARTPIEDASIEWEESVAPFMTIGTLTIPQQDLAADDAVALAEEIDGLAFNPWNGSETLRPLGSQNRARRRVYDASAAFRGAR
jgi:hypothetical protein